MHLPVAFRRHFAWQSSCTSPNFLCAASAVARRYAEEMISAKRPAAALPALKRAIQLLSGGDSGTLTAAHACFLQAALAAKHLGAARRLAETPVFHVQSSDLGTHHSDIMLHFFYSGSVLCAFQRWKEAAAAFRTAIAVPASALSAIALESYKKYICACLLHEGRVAPLPRHVSSAVARSLPAAAAAYGALSKAVAALSDEKLAAVMHQHAGTFAADQNSGLVQQVAASMRRRRVLRLTSTFVTLSLADIAAKTGLASAAEAEAELLCMVQEGQLSASIDHRVGVVTFPPEQGAFASPAEMQSLRSSMAQATALAQHFARAQQEAELSDDFLEPRVRQAAIAEGKPLHDGAARGGGGASGRGAGGGASGGAGGGWDGFANMASGFLGGGGGHK